MHHHAAWHYQQYVPFSDACCSVDTLLSVLYWHPSQFQSLLPGASIYLQSAITALASGAVGSMFSGPAVQVSEQQQGAHTSTRLMVLPCTVTVAHSPMACVVSCNNLTAPFAS
jgi:hypothetical protein